MKKTILAISFLVCAAASAQNQSSANMNVRCSVDYNGQVVLRRISDGQNLPSYYFSNLESCEKAVKGAREGLVCVMTSETEAMPASIKDGIYLGEHYFSNLDSCVKSVANQKNGKICLAGPGADMAAVYIKADKRYFDEQYRSSLENCLNAL